MSLESLFAKQILEKYYSSAATPQPDPKPGQVNIAEKVIEDINSRIEMGKGKHGTLLQSFNGRDALMDAYQEQIDLLMYMKQELVERSTIEKLIVGDLDKDSQNLVINFCQAIARKMMSSTLQYGWTNDWLNITQSECREELYKHLKKGDPIDVAIYCAFMWYHGWSTKE